MLLQNPKNPKAELCLLKVGNEVLSGEFWWEPEKYTQ